MIKTIRRILSEIKPYKNKIIIIALAGLLNAFCTSRVLFMLKDLSDSLQKGEQDRIGQIALIAMGLALTVAISRYFHLFLMNYVAECITNDYRASLQKKFMNLNLAFHSGYAAGSGGLMSRIMNDIKVIQDGLRMLADLFRAPILLVLLLVNLFVLNWRVTCSILILLPTILFLIKSVSKSLKKYLVMGQESLESITSTIKESLDGVRIIQSFNLESEMQRKLRVQSEEYLAARKKVHARVEIMGPITEFLATILILGIFFYFSVEVAHGHTTIGSILSYLASMLSINDPIKKFQESYVRIQETIVAADRVYHVLDEKSEVPLPTNPQPFPQNWKKIVYKNVSFAYGKELVLKDVSFEIHRGQQVAFVGQSGSGKSTIVNLLERFYDPTSGQILIDETPIQNIDLKELRHNIGLVTQDVFLFSDTIERNINAGDFSKNTDRVFEVARKANADIFISKLPEKYQSKVGERGSLLSGGEKQRISIARAFFKDSPILILDEATSALDSASEVEVQKGLDSLAAGRTSLVIAHRLSTIQNAEKIYVMKLGQIVESGTHSELLQKKSEYFNFYQMQNREAILV